jgi:hypothetical protein
MTARAWLERRLRRLVVPSYVGGTLFLAAWALGLWLGPVVTVVVGLPAFALTLAAAVIGYYTRLCCPICRGNLAPLVWGGQRVSPKVRFCPYCGADLDAELPPSGGGNNSPAADPGD